MRSVQVTRLDAATSGGIVVIYKISFQIIFNLISLAE